MRVSRRFTAEFTEIEAGPIVSGHLNLADRDFHFAGISEQAVSPMIRTLADRVLAHVRDDMGRVLSGDGDRAEAASRTVRIDESRDRKILRELETELIARLHIRWYQLASESIPWSDLGGPDEVATFLYLNRGPATDHGGPVEPESRWPWRRVRPQGAIWVPAKVSALEIVFSVARQAYLLYLLAGKEPIYPEEVWRVERAAIEYGLRIVQGCKEHSQADEA
jgi:hypothetical protein